MDLVTSKFENNILTLCFHGKIDSSTADQAEAIIKEARGNNSDGNVIIDADDLEYISSAGLRVVLRLRKAEADLKIINVSSEVYEVFEMTGFTEMMTVEKGYRKLSVDGCPVIGKGAKGTVYRYNPDTIIKVYHNNDSLPEIQNERKLAKTAFVLGVPTAIPYDVVRVGEKFGSVFELLAAKSYSQLFEENPEKIDEYMKSLTDLLKTIHSTIVKPDSMPDIKDKIFGWIKRDEKYLTEEQASKLKNLVTSVPDTMNMLHCDYHSNNIMMQNGETLLIDMDTLSHGHPIFELANIYITYVGFGEIDPSIVEQFIGLPYETSKTIWKKFLPLYLETNDEAKLKEVEDKAKILVYSRLMSHSIKRNENTEEGQKTIKYAAEQIGKLLETVTTLEF